jgi:hypothetical protein
MGIARYVFIFAVWGFVIAGAYWAGYSVGSRDVKIEYVVKEKEVIKYVSKKNEKIYLRPNDNFTAIYKRMREQS